MAKTKTIPRVIAEFVGSDPAFNGLFVYEALNRYAQHVMSLDPKDHERSLISLTLMQDIAQYWHDLTHEESGK
jgi:hypothetical protein